MISSPFSLSKTFFCGKEFQHLINPQGFDNTNIFEYFQQTHECYSECTLKTYEIDR